MPVNGGGLPFASVAVTKQSNPLTEFGEVTLIGDRNYIDPKGKNRAEIYGADIHSKRYDHTDGRSLDEIVETMKANYRRNSNNPDGFGMSYAIQQATPQFDSIEDIQQNKSRLVPRSEYDATIDALNAQAIELSRTLDQSYLDVLNGLSHLAHPDVESAAELIEDVFPNANTLNKQNAVKEMLIALRDMPTTYFEGKAKDVTQFSDFAGAVIPDNLPKNAYDVLKGAGLSIYEYDPSNPNSRADVIKQATNELNELHDGDILFSKKQSAMEQAKSGKSIPRETLLDQMLSMDKETYKALFQKGKSKVAEQLADSHLSYCPYYICNQDELVHRMVDNRLCG